MVQVDGGSSDASGLGFHLSLLPESPLGLGEHAVQLTVANPLRTATCNATLTVTVCPSASGLPTSSYLHHDQHMRIRPMN